MNDGMHDLLNKLRVIGKVQKGQKLDVANGVLNVYVDGWFNWIGRKWNRDSKDEGIRFLRDLYKSLQQSIDPIIRESQNNQNDAKKSMSIYVLINTATELKASIKGIENLSKTYVVYPTTVAALEGILRDYVIVTYSALIDAIPEQKLTNELRESIMYNNTIVYHSATPPSSMEPTENDLNMP